VDHDGVEPGLCRAVLSRVKSVCIASVRQGISVSGALSRRPASASRADLVLPDIARDVIVRGWG
jgi:hypothetical protein